MDKYILYARRSQDRDDKQALSIENQISEGKKIAKKQNVYLTEILTEDMSSKKPGRPIFNKLINMLDTGLYSGVICWDAARLSRNSVDAGQIVWLMDQDKLKEIITYTKSYKNTPEDKFTIHLEFGMAKNKVDRLSIDVKRGMEKAVESGYWPGTIRLGYLNIDDQGRISGKNYDPQKQSLLDKQNRKLFRIEQDPIVAPRIKNLFHEFISSNKTYKQLAKYATDIGLEGRRGKKLSASQIHKILKDKIYIGIMTYKGQEFKGAFTPIVSQEIFNIAQNKFKNKGKPKINNWGHKFTNLIRCPDCGCYVTAYTKIKHYKSTNRTAKYTYYCCSKRKGPCNQKPIKAIDLENQLDEVVKSIQIGSETRKEALKILKTYYAEQIKNDAEIRSRWRNSQNKLNDKRKKLIDLYIEGMIDQEDYKVKKSEIESELEVISSQLDATKNNVENWLELVEQYFEFSNVAYDIYKNHATPEEQKEILKSIGWNFYLDDKKLLYNKLEPFKTIEFCIDLENWWT